MGTNKPSCHRQVHANLGIRAATRELSIVNFQLSIDPRY
jgi:hypothetical protein